MFSGFSSDNDLDAGSAGSLRGGSGVGAGAGADEDEEEEEEEGAICLAAVGSGDGGGGTASTTADDVAALASVATVEGALRGEDFSAATAYSKSNNNNIGRRY